MCVFLFLVVVYTIIFFFFFFFFFFFAFAFPALTSVTYQNLNLYLVSLKIFEWRISDFLWVKFHILLKFHLFLLYNPKASRSSVCTFAREVLICTGTSFLVFVVVGVEADDGDIVFVGGVEMDDSAVVVGVVEIKGGIVIGGVEVDDNIVDSMFGVSEKKASSALSSVSPSISSCRFGSGSEVLNFLGSCSGL
eukprot:TRINITY_DN15708_c0_g1_i1.p1 TRINITY_DN15708_c0_g1~~TRINITY_DN15708_c0_g1_i1.p1  ORF type:complete len:193 (+),score=35.42 TRINITY_DN15708_c0_g1_i1:128-706(+)